MSQAVGQNFKSKIPTFGDDASIQEAFRLYHYGVDEYTTQTIPDDSIEGNFRSIDSRVDTIESTLSTAISGYVSKISSVSNPNIITGQTATAIPVVVRAITSQTSNLQQWQDSSSNIVGRVSTGGSIGLAGYGSIGSATLPTTTALSVSILNSSHKGLLIKSAISQSSNIQEWQNSAGTAISWVNNNGEIYSQGNSVQTVSPFLLMGS